MASGLMYLYGVVAGWESLPIAREISVICELADRRTRSRLPAGWPRGCAVWLHRLRYVAAQSDDERVRVVDEACAERRHAVATSPFPHDLSPPVMEAGELSRAIEDASLEAARLGGSKALREKMEMLTRDLVVELQDLGWQVTSARTSLVSPEDVSSDARDAESQWRAELAGVDSDLLARISWLALRESPLQSPPGLDEASESHRLNVGRHRGQIRAHGFVAPDTLRSKNLDELAYAEMSRHRQETWGLVVVEALTTAVVEGDEGLSSVFSGPMIRPEIAERFVHALRLFLTEDYDAAAHVILPRLETSIRAVAVARRIPALQIAYKSLGNISYLDALLRELEHDALPHAKAHWANLRLLLVDGQGASIRNTLSHGLRSDGGVGEVVSPQEAALLLYVAMFLSALNGQGDHPRDLIS